MKKCFMLEMKTKNNKEKVLKITENMDNNVYRKVGPRKYVPFGVKYDENYLPDGIWFARHGEYSHGHTNVDKYLGELFKVGEAKPIDLTEVCGLYNVAEKVMENEGLREMFFGGGVSYHDFICKVIAVINEIGDAMLKKV